MPTDPAIPFNRSSIAGSEIEHIRDAVASGQIAGNQAYARRCQNFLKETLGVPEALMTTSCTHALEMAALLLGFEPGDEVILPTYTFVSTANAFVLRGARPIFCDIRPDTLNLDETRIESLITGRTRAIVPVHYAGVGCEMDAILEIARRHGIGVVEDNAHGLFGKYRGRPLGSFGQLSVQSFHETKNITCGEGGALLINDLSLFERAEIIREKGTDRARFFRGEVDKYTWVDIGSSYVMSDVLAAFLFGQLEAWQSIQQKRQTIWERYDNDLREWCAAHGVRQPSVPAHCEQAWHLYYLLMPDPPSQAALISHLKERGIGAVFHYRPLHLSPFALQWGNQAGQCPVAEDVSDRIVRLPLFYALSPGEQDRVIGAILEFDA
ncbi:MAG: dTDP-4-amino-4,6-dideoxygalactose transaminase [Verrucomicrobiae bacterium]|nr:dTDP-4-amino-4,6-dideoxygalactose transaminase [Verrucomicrobiae bacterium]MCP5540632.1 dTDP-4-amino-4,6-dideoxygalactose transaminase [Akkermansiaceae bacterium]